MNEVIMQLYKYLILSSSILFGYSIYAGQDLMVNDAIKIIWKMNYKDISKLHNIVFEQSSNNKSVIDRIEATGKIFQTLDKTWCKSQQTQILEMLFSESISTEQKERILQAIKNSYKEYKVDYNVVNYSLFTILFPRLSLLMANNKHIKAIEAKRLTL